jgi:hypothetical protein
MGSPQRGPIFMGAGGVLRRIQPERQSRPGTKGKIAGVEAR